MAHIGSAVWHDLRDHSCSNQLKHRTLDHSHCDAHCGLTRLLVLSDRGDNHFHCDCQHAVVRLLADALGHSLIVIHECRRRLHHRGDPADTLANCLSLLIVPSDACLHIRFLWHSWFIHVCDACRWLSATLLDHY